MKSLLRITLALAALSGCATARTAPTPQPTPVPAPAASAPAPTPPAAAPAPTPATVVRSALREAPRDWQLLDEARDGVPGISATRAYRELLASRRPARSVVVAVIDGGIDTLHADLRANLWRNPKEVAGNGKDDDGNGFADDVYGWDFIGGPGGDVHWDTFEVTRLYVQCRAAPSGGPSATPPGAAGKPRCDEITSDFEKQRREAEDQLPQIRQIDAAYARILPLLRGALGGDSLTTERVEKLQSSRPDVQQARTIYLQLAASDITPAVIAEAKEEIEGRLQYNLNPSFDPRPMVGDRYADVTQRRYGNTDVMGPDAKHGTHVGGIIGAVRDNGLGIDGIAPSVRIMMVRAVPDGDERDKDIANAIRYAVDNGAQVINMSFGKGYSPQKPVVDEAVKYADAHGVLMVHAAGNDGADLAVKPNFPKPVYLDGGHPANWIEVGASSWKGGDSLAARFSNYDHDLVDVFAPGVDILSTVPGGGYERESGTSMAAPVVSGLAAMLMAYYPSLSAGDVKRIILASATRHSDQMVVRPGAENGEKVPFGSLSATGAIVNAYQAVRMAEQAAGARP